MTELPTTFGKYFLTEKLAAGGMAEIYLAKIVGPGGFEKPLVIKKIHPALSGQRHFVDLFVAEAKTLVTLAHGNIVPVYELGVIDDTYFIAMEYIDGPTLYRFTEALVRRDERMEPAVAAWIAARILEGLDYAHRKGDGVIHRDLSPRNVMLSRDGEVKLVDFGIAVPLGAADDGGDSQSAPTGSFPYMSPEQVRREPLTGQTDLFSAGVLLWEMLTGRRLFARADPDATLRAVTDGDIPRASRAGADIPARLDELVARALERDRATRWPSAGDMLHELQRYLYSLDATPGPRDVAALVARLCPPETRRLPTHADPPEPGAPVILGPRTAKIDRPDAAPAGKKRARTETFATNVDLRNILERATPLFPIPALTDPELAPTHVAAAAAPAPAPTAPVADGSAPSPAPLALPVPGRTPPSTGLLLLLSFGTLALGIAAVVVFLRSRARHITAPPEAGVALPAPADAPAPPPDAPPAPLDAPPAPLDASPAPADAAVAAIRRPDAPPADAAAAPVGEATLIIGADPWGDILVDNVARGRTPTTLTVPAGRHTIEVVFRGEDPPRTRRYTKDLRPGQVERIDADFTKP